MQRRITPATRPHLAPRYQRMLDLLQQETLSLAEVAQRLKLKEGVARSYLSEVAKVADVRRLGVHGQARYHIVERPTNSA